jgi:hypothetical protein
MAQRGTEKKNNNSAFRCCPFQSNEGVFTFEPPLNDSSDATRNNAGPVHYDLILVTGRDLAKLARKGTGG